MTGHFNNTTVHHGCAAGEFEKTLEKIIKGTHSTYKETTVLLSGCGLFFFFNLSPNFIGKNILTCEIRKKSNNLALHFFNIFCCCKILKKKAYIFLNFNSIALENFHDTRDL